MPTTNSTRETSPSLRKSKFSIRSSLSWRRIILQRSTSSAYFSRLSCVWRIRPASHDTDRITWHAAKNRTFCVASV